jgi:hypothetical protein
METGKMTNPNDQILRFYSEPGLFTDLGEYAPLNNRFPPTINERVARVQGLMVNIFWAEGYGVTPSEARQDELNIRTAEAKIRRILELDGQPLTTSRIAEHRLLGNSRDYVTLLVAVLRQGGLPARARCGFATYFQTGRYEDHWIVEYWRQDDQRWVKVDGLVDAFLRQALNIEWDQFDLPGGLFVSGGRSWIACREGEANPDDFGVFEYKGLDFVRGNLMRDILSLNKVEPLPWDFWGYLNTPVEQLLEPELRRFDQLARRRQLHQASQVHHPNAPFPGEILGQRQIVGDEEHGQSHVLFEPQQGGEQADADGNDYHRDGFIGDDE